MLGLRFSRLVHAALASGGLTLTGCPGGGGDSESESETESGSDGTDTSDTSDPTTTTSTTDVPPPPPPPPPPDTPPALLAVEALDPQILRLTFTEPMAPVDAVNPKRFRLSAGRFRSEAYYGYARTLYTDVEVYNHQEYCNENCYEYYECYYQCYYGPNLPVDVLDALPDAYNPAQVVLLLSAPITRSLCNFANQFSGNPQIPGGLLLHYADGGAAQLTDLAGLPVVGFGETWVKETDEFTRYVDDLQFPELVPFLPIPCPF